MSTHVVAARKNVAAVKPAAMELAHALLARPCVEASVSTPKRTTPTVVSVVDPVVPGLPAPTGPVPAPQVRDFVRANVLMYRRTKPTVGLVATSVELDRPVLPASVALLVAPTIATRTISSRSGEAVAVIQVVPPVGSASLATLPLSTREETAAT